MRHLTLGLLTIVLILSIVSKGSAQDSVFQIDSYIPERFTDFEWRLSINSGLSSSNSDNLDPTSSRTASDRNLSLNSLWSYRYETMDRWLTLEPQVSGSIRGYDRDLETTFRDDRYYRFSRDENDYRNQDLSISAYIESGTYVSNDFYLITTIRPSFRYSEQPDNDLGTFYEYIYPYGLDSLWKTIGYDTTESSSVSHDYRVDLQAGAGIGRVYRGAFAYTALSMISELRTAGYLNREPSYDDMVALTETIYQNRMRHAIDERVHRMESLNQILTLLADRQILDDNGPGAFVRIQDVWDYFPRSLRRFGMRVGGGLGWEYVDDRNRNSSLRQEHSVTSQYAADSSDFPGTPFSSDYTYHRYTSESSTTSEPYVFAQVSYYHPLSTNWQLDLVAEGRWFVDAYTDWDHTNRYYSPVPQTDQQRYRLDYEDYLQAELDIDVRYFLDSRTSLTGSFSTLVFTRDVYQDTVEVEYVYRQNGTMATYRVDSQLGGKLTYRVSLPTTLRVSANVRRVYSEENTRVDDDDWNYSLGLSLEHYLF